MMWSVDSAVVLLMSGAPLVSPDQADILQVGGQTVVEGGRLTVLNVPAIYSASTEDLLDLPVPPLVRPGGPRHGSTDSVLLQAPGSP